MFVDVTYCHCLNIQNFVLNLMTGCCCVVCVCVCVCVCAGFSQGVRRSVGGLATILGPLWAGGLIGNLYVMLGMMMLLLTLILVREQTLYNRFCNIIRDFP